MPSARFLDESSYGFMVYDGTPDQKIIATASPYDWFEASVFYTNIQDKPYPGFEQYQDYKDKGFNFKIRIKEEGKFPAIAIGINDLAGTGYYGSEYIVSSYGVGKLDMHFGLGWGNLNGYDDFRNPLTELSEGFKSRPKNYSLQGGSIDSDRFFSGSSVSNFFGISYILNNKTLLKFERDTTLTPGLMEYEENESEFSFGIDFSLNKNFTIGASIERNNFFSIRFSFKENINERSNYKYKKTNIDPNKGKYSNFRKSLQENGIGVNKIVENDDFIGVELTQFKHPSLDILDEIIYRAKADSRIDKEVIPNYKIADLSVIENYGNEVEKNSDLIYERNRKRNFSTDTKLNIRPFIAGREGFLKIAALLENNSEFVIRDNLMFSSNIKYSLWDNFDDLVIPPVDTYPAQVRSDVKDYLRNFNEGIIIGRAQLDYYKTLSNNHHLMFTAGILEEMFSGYGIEYLWFNHEKNYAAGFEVFDVVKRDYNLRFGNLDYKNVTGHVNFYYRNHIGIPFDAKISFGEYLAGDVGSTIQLSRTFRSGILFGAFASKTNVNSVQFGEGSFDKGIFFEIPIYGNFLNYSWRPLTKDPAQKLVRKNSLHDLLVKFKPLD